MEYRIKKLFVYPVKSFGGFSVSSHSIDARGFIFDRRWMLIDDDNLFITQRTVPELALFNASLEENRITISHKRFSEFHLELSLNEHTEIKTEAIIFGDKTEGYLLNDKINKELSGVLGMNVRIIFMGEDLIRVIDKRYANNDEIVSFADGFPFLLLGENSLIELNKRLKNKVGYNRFRPNIVFSGGEPFDEDEWKTIGVRDIQFRVVKPCSRCSIVTVEQNTAERDNEALKALSEFRQKNNKVYFGQNLVHNSGGLISVDDKIKIIE